MKGESNPVVIVELSTPDACHQHLLASLSLGLLAGLSLGTFSVTFICVVTLLMTWVASHMGFILLFMVLLLLP
jgi:hypothetical protein